MNDVAARFARGLAGYEASLGLAVSGGGDSMAMLHLAAGLGVRVVTVDHGLRPEAAEEAAAVGRVCAALGLRHDILHWHWDQRGNLQDAARRGRRALMAQWACGHGLGAVALAHTQDDLAETFVMRLARGAGVDGLAAMSARWQEAGITWLRPLLTTTRAELRDVLHRAGAEWSEDPSNDNRRFDRVKVRQALAVLRPLGITAERLADVAGHLAQARDALAQATETAAARVLSHLGGAVRIDAAWANEAAEVQRRLLVQVIATIAPASYGPRGPAVQALRDRVLAGRPAVLAGCRFVLHRGQLWACREARGVAGLVVPAGQVWDGRWCLVGPEGSEIRALGAGLTLCPDWRATGLPRAALLASPSLWLNGRLIAAPHAGFEPLGGAISLFPATPLQELGLSH